MVLHTNKTTKDFIRFLNEKKIIIYSDQLYLFL